MPEQFDAHNTMAAFNHDSTLVVALELSGKSWQVGAVVPGVARRPRRRLEPRDMAGLLKAIEQWKAEVAGAGRVVRRVALTPASAGAGSTRPAATVFGLRAICRPFRDHRAVAGFAGLTGTPFRSAGIEREQGIGKNGNARVRRIVMQLAWRWLRFQPQSALAQWFAARTGGAKGRIRMVMIVALARKLLVAPCSQPGAGLWRYTGTGEVPAGARLAAA